MTKITRLITLLAVTALVAPAAAIAGHSADPGSHGKGKVQRCKKSNKVAFVVGGTAVNAVPTTPAAGDEYVTITDTSGDVVTFLVTRANRHAKKWLAADEGQTAELDADQITFPEGQTAANEGDKVKAIGKTGQKRNCTTTKAVSLKKVTVSAPEPAPTV